MGGIFTSGGDGGAKKTAKVNKEIYESNKALLTPFVTPAMGSQAAYAELLGLTQPGGGAGAPAPSTGSGGGSNNSLDHAFGNSGATPTPAASTTPSATSAFQNYLNSTGHQFRLDQGSKAITGNKAAMGMLNSGSTLKALDTFGQNIGTEDFTNYMNMLSSLTGSGLSAAGSLAGAGNTYAGQVANTNAMAAQAKQQNQQNLTSSLGSLASLAMFM